MQRVGCYRSFREVASLRDRLTALQRACVDINLPDALTAWIIDAGGERQIISVADPAAPAVDTFLKLDAPQVSLTSKNPTDWKPGSATPTSSTRTTGICARC